MRPHPGWGCVRGRAHLRAFRVRPRLKPMRSVRFVALADAGPAPRVGASADVELRDAHDLTGARALGTTILDPPPVSVPDGRPTIERVCELRAGANAMLDPAAGTAILRGLKAVGGSVCSLRRALMGRDRGPQVSAETLRRVDAPL